MNARPIAEIETVLNPVTRWTHARKLWLLTAIDWGNITADAACKLHAISPVELQRWRELRDASGSSALKQKNIQAVPRGRQIGTTRRGA